MNATRAGEILNYTKEKPIEHYVCKYLQKRLANIHKTDLGYSMIYQDVFYWVQFEKQKPESRERQKTLGVGHFF